MKLDPITLTEYLRRRKANREADPRDPFAGPSMLELLAPCIDPPAVELEPVYPLSCSDCGAEYLISADSLAQWGAPHCACGAGALGCEAFEAMRREALDAEARADGTADRLVSRGWVDTRKTHYCDHCHGDIYARDRAERVVRMTPEGFRSSYLCGHCAMPGGGRNPNGTKFYNETQSEALASPWGF